MSLWNYLRDRDVTFSKTSVCVSPIRALTTTLKVAYVNIPVRGAARDTQKYFTLTISNQDNTPAMVSTVATKSCCAINADDSVVLHAISPVRVNKQGNGKTVTTYVFYDNSNNGCLLTDAALRSRWNPNYSLVTYHAWSML